MRPRRPGRRPPPPDPYGAARASRTRVWRTPGGARLVVWLLVFALGLAAAAFLAALLVTRDGDEPEVERTQTTATLPNVLGTQHVQAGARLERLGVVVDSFPIPGSARAGTVVAQSPGPGSEVGPGSLVRLDVSLGPGERAQVAVPDVTGRPARAARSRVREAALTVQTIVRDAPSREEVGEVLAQQPAAGTLAPALSQVHLYVGR